MLELLPLKRGDFVVIVFDGCEMPAMVVLASTNHRSVMLMFDGMIGGWIRQMPVSWDEVGGYHCLAGNKITLRKETVH